jgi:hypothetical protein
MCHRLRETHLWGVCRRIELTLLRDPSQAFGIPNFGQLFRAKIEVDGRCKVSGVVLGYDQKLLLDSLFIELQIALLYYCQPFNRPTTVECFGLDCKKQFTYANQGIMPESHNIWVQYIECDLDNTFPGRVFCIPVLYFSWTPTNLILQLQEH